MRLIFLFIDYSLSVGLYGIPRKITTPLAPPPVREEVMSAGKFGRYKTEVEEMIERRGRLALRNTVESEKHLEICGGLREGIGMKTY